MNIKTLLSLTNFDHEMSHLVFLDWLQSLNYTRSSDEKRVWEYLIANKIRTNSMHNPFPHVLLQDYSWEAIGEVFVYIDEVHGYFIEWVETKITVTCVMFGNIRELSKKNMILNIVTPK